MENINPYENPSKKLVKKNIGRYQNYIRSKIKNQELAETVLEIISMCQYSAFESGKKQGRFEVSKKLNELLTIENPEIENFEEY